MRRLLIARLQSGVALPPVVNPPGAYALVSLAASSGATAAVGSAVTATAAPGLSGIFQFIRDGLPITGATASGNSATYTVSGTETVTAAGYTKSADTQGLLDCQFELTKAAVGLTASLDSTAFLSFYGSFAVGSTVTARVNNAETSGTLRILRGDGSVAATASAASVVSYVVQSSDIAKGPPTAEMTDAAIQHVFSNNSGSVGSNPQIEYITSMYGSTTAENDVFEVRLRNGTRAVTNFLSAGVAVTSSQLKNRSFAYGAVASDAGHQITSVITRLTYQTGGLYGTPVVASSTVAPTIYGIVILDSARDRIRASVPPYGNLDTSVPFSTSEYSISGTVGATKTVIGRSFDNSSSDEKTFDLILSSPFQPDDAPILNSPNGSNVKYVGGSPMAAFSGWSIYSYIPPRGTPLWSDGSNNGTSPTAGTVQFSSTSEYVTCLQLDSVANIGSRRISSDKDCTLEMSILADWTDSSIIRQIAFDGYPPTYGDSNGNREQWALRRTGNTVAFREKPNGFFDGGSNAQVASYTFSPSGSNCRARLRYEVDVGSGFCYFEVSTDGSDTWSTVYKSTTNSGASNIYPTAWANTTTLAITGVAGAGFTQN